MTCKELAKTRLPSASCPKGEAGRKSVEGKEGVETVETVESVGTELPAMEGVL